MADITVIKNNFLTVEIDSFGAELIKMLCYDTLEALDRADNCDFLKLEKLCLSQYPFTENLYDNILIDEPCVVSVNIHSDL